MNSGVPNSAMTSDTTAAMRTAFTSAPPSAAASRSPSNRSPASRLDFTSTTSPGASSASSSASARSASGTSRTRVPVDAGCRAPRRARPRPAPRPPGRRRRARRRRGATTSAPTSACSASDSSPSSSISPSTAQVRRPSPIRASAVERGAHRVGVRVVGVVDDGDAVGPLDDLHPPAADRSRGLQRGTDRLERQAELGGHGGRGERVADVVRPTRPRCTGAGCPAGRAQVNEARPPGVEARRPSARTSASSASPTRTTRAVVTRRPSRARAGRRR